jgi:putative transposase
MRAIYEKLFNSTFSPYKNILFPDNTLIEHHRHWIDDALNGDSHQRESRWSESVAVGSKTFVEQTRQQLGYRAKGRKMYEDEETYTLRETGEDYYFSGKNSTLSPENTYCWDYNA